MPLRETLVIIVYYKKVIHYMFSQTTRKEMGLDYGLFVNHNSMANSNAPRNLEVAITIIT